MQILNLEQPKDWPEALTEYLESTYETFLSWEMKREGLSDAQVSAAAFDRAIYGLRDILNGNGYAIVGFHCTRLTASEMTEIKLAGLALPNQAMLKERIEAVVCAKQLCPEIAKILQAKNQAHEECRANKLWFCFFPPRIAEQWGIERFFRSWGGEALYNMHEDNDLTGRALNTIGAPCIVVAKIPVNSLAEHGGLDEKIARRFIVSKGVNLKEPVDHEDYIIKSLGPEHVIDIVEFPSRRFSELSGCDTWQPPLSLQSSESEAAS